jgi:CBS domain containing-hemolysin-like protein
MFEILFLVIAVAVMVYAILLIRSFEYMSLSELKRQSRSGNDEARLVYPVRAYGIQLWIVLWSVLGLSTAVVVISLHALIGTLWTIVINIPLVVLVHAILPWTRRPMPSLRLAAVASPILEKVLRFLYPVLSYAEKAVGKWIEPEPILLIRSRDELLEILSHNAEEFDHVSKSELKIAENALIFGDKKVGDYMTPLSSVYFVSADELLSPVVLGELHDSGHSRFPVVQGSNQNIVGTLFLKDAMRVNNSQKIREIMRPDVYYVNELQTLNHALKAFIKTKHHLFVVVNEFEDVVGVITIEDVIEQIIGKQIVDEFDKYDDLRAVAKHYALQKQAEQQEEAVEI